LTAAAEALAEQLLREAGSTETTAERRRRERLGRMLADPRGRRFVLALTDQVVRIRDPRRAARRYRDLVAGGGLAFAGPLDRTLATLGAGASLLAPRPVVALVVRRLRSETRGVVLPAEDPALARHLASRREDGFADWGPA